MPLFHRRPDADHIQPTPAAPIMPVRLGLTIGILWGTGVLLLAICANHKYGSLIFKGLQEMYIGCDNRTKCGLLVCTLMGALDGFIGGALIGLLYNALPVYV